MINILNVLSGGTQDRQKLQPAPEETALPPEEKPWSANHPGEKRTWAMPAHPEMSYTSFRRRCLREYEARWAGL